MSNEIDVFNESQIKLIKDTICKGASDDDLKLFLHACKRTKLDPFMKQIYSIPRGNARTIQVSIDGYRLIAERTNRYSPGKEPVYAFDDQGRLISATSSIKKMTEDGTWHDVSATAFLDEYKGSTPFWTKMPKAQLAKCAEALALRKAFPYDLSGIYTNEEMEQADSLPDKNEVISQEQAEELRELFEKVDVSYKKSIIVGLNAAHKITKWEDLPLRLYDQIKENALRQATTINVEVSNGDH